MMSTNKTQNYQLHQWLPEDDFLRTEFNENFTLLDLTLAEGLKNLEQSKAKVLTGAYVGDGTNDRKISLDYTPQAVYVSNDSGLSAFYINSNPWYYGGLALAGRPVTASERGVLKTVLAVDTGGFRVTDDGVASSNRDGSVYYYFAIC